MKSLGGHTSSAVQHFIYLTLTLVSALFCLIVFLQLVFRGCHVPNSGGFFFFFKPYLLWKQGLNDCAVYVSPHSSCHWN